MVVSDKGLKEGTAILFRLNPGKTVADAEQFLKEKRAEKDPNNTVELGAIVFDAEAESGVTNEAQTDLQPGTYLVLIGGSKGEPALRDTFTVAAGGAAALALPAPQATERTIEFGFKGPTTLHDGELVRFENEGFVVHMDVAFPVKNMKAAKKAVKLLRAGNEKAVGKLIAGAAGGLLRPALPRRRHAGDDHGEARDLRPGVLHGDPGRPRPRHPGHGADHQDHEVARTAPAGPVPGARVAPGAASGLRSRRRCAAAGGAQAPASWAALTIRMITDTIR